MKIPNFKYERQLWNCGLKYVAGVDEVGRGCFAGPVVASAVAFAPQSTKDLKLKTEKENIFIDDSKKVTKLRRERAAKWIKENALAWGIGETSAAAINRLGMAKATKMAFRRAVADANRRRHKRIQFLLVDAFYIPYLRGFPRQRKSAKGNKNAKDSRARQLAIVNGDEKSLSIAAASIIAKVYRDSLMEKIGNRARYKKYDWVSNKGYATKVHREAILKYGTIGYHRKQFVESFLLNSKTKSAKLKVTT
jgi:ribonuclease HII